MRLKFFGINRVDSTLTPVAGLEFEQVVQEHHSGLYRFAASLAGQDAEALDLTQQTFYLWATKGSQLRDPSKVKSWLFTTLYREFIRGRRRFQRHPHVTLHLVEGELPHVTSSAVDQMDAELVMEALSEVDELYRAPLTMFYMDDSPYKEISERLGVPIGTVMSRISRGKEQLRRLLAKKSSRNRSAPEARVDP